MFEGKRYVTKGVLEGVPGYLQNLIWYMISIMPVSEKDYLQVFELSEVLENGKVFQKIVHSQEVPEYKNEEIITVSEAINEKVYVIDDETHSTILLAEEY